MVRGCEGWRAPGTLAPGRGAVHASSVRGAASPGIARAHVSSIDGLIGVMDAGGVLRDRPMSCPDPFGTREGTGAETHLWTAQSRHNGTPTVVKEET